MAANVPIAESRRATPSSRAVAHGVQAKLKVGPAHDAYEQEADRVAEAVVGRSGGAAQVPSPVAIGPRRNAGPATPSLPRISRLVHRAVEEEEPQAKLQLQDEEEPQAKLQLQEEEPQARLQLQEEEEPQARLQFQEEEEPQAKLQLQEEEEEAQPKLQRQGEPLATTSPGGRLEGTDRLDATLQATKGGGRALPSETRAQMEAGIGADFSGVRVHTDATAVQMNQALGAQAFTHGGDVYFNAGKYEPESSRGKTLLAHELTHTVQQGAAQRKS